MVSEVVGGDVPWLGSQSTHVRFFPFRNQAYREKEKKKDFPGLK